MAYPFLDNGLIAATEPPFWAEILDSDLKGAYAWRELEETEDGTFIDAVRREGTLLDGAAYEVEHNASVPVGSVVLLWRGCFGSQQDWRFIYCCARHAAAIALRARDSGDDLDTGSRGGPAIAFRAPALVLPLVSVFLRLTTGFSLPVSTPVFVKKRAGYSLPELTPGYASMCVGSAEIIATAARWSIRANDTETVEDEVHDTAVGIRARASWSAIWSGGPSACVKDQPKNEVAETASRCAVTASWAAIWSGGPGVGLQDHPTIVPVTETPTQCQAKVTQAEVTETALRCAVTASWTAIWSSGPSISLQDHPTIVPVTETPTRCQAKATQAEVTETTSRCAVTASWTAIWSGGPSIGLRDHPEIRMEVIFNGAPVRAVAVRATWASIWPSGPSISCQDHPTIVPVTETPTQCQAQPACSVPSVATNSTAASASWIAIWSGGPGAGVQDRPFIVPVTETASPFSMRVTGSSVAETAAFAGVTVSGSVPWLASAQMSVVSVTSCPELTAATCSMGVSPPCIKTDCCSCCVPPYPIGVISDVNVPQTFKFAMSFDGTMFVGFMSVGGHTYDVQMECVSQDLWQGRLDKDGGGMLDMLWQGASASKSILEYVSTCKPLHQIFGKDDVTLIVSECGVGRALP